MFLTWRLSKEAEGQEVEVAVVEAGLVGEMEENKSKRPVGVPSLAPTRSSEQLCQLVKSEFFSTVDCGTRLCFWYTNTNHIRDHSKTRFQLSFRDNVLIYLDFQVHSVPSDNPGEVCFWAWERWEPYYHLSKCNFQALLSVLVLCLLSFMPTLCWGNRCIIFFAPKVKWK